MSTNITPDTNLTRREALATLGISALSLLVAPSEKALSAEPKADNLASLKSYYDLLKEKDVTKIGIARLDPLVFFEALKEMKAAHFNVIDTVFVPQFEKFIQVKTKHGERSKQAQAEHEEVLKIGRKLGWHATEMGTMAIRLHPEFKATYLPIIKAEREQLKDKYDKVAKQSLLNPKDQALLIEKVKIGEQLSPLYLIEQRLEGKLAPRNNK